MTPYARVALLAGLALAASPAAASTTLKNDAAPAAKTTLLQLAQGATPEGWRVEQPPRYKKASSKMNEVTTFRDDGPARYKKKKSTSQ